MPLADTNWLPPFSTVPETDAPPLTSCSPKMSAPLAVPLMLTTCTPLTAASIE